MVGDNARGLAIRRSGKAVHLLRQRNGAASRAYRAEVAGDSAGVRNLRRYLGDT